MVDSNINYAVWYHTINSGEQQMTREKLLVKVLHREKDKDFPGQRSYRDYFDSVSQITLIAEQTLWLFPQQ